MNRARIAWLLSLAFMGIGGLVAHVLAYRLVEPDHEMRDGMLMASGHAYMSHWRLCLAVCATVAVIGLVASIVSQVRRSRVARVPLWVFGLVPPVGFVLQEHLERWLHHGAFPHAAALEPTFLIGVLLQLPVALLAFVVARALLAAADVLVRTLGGLPRARVAAAGLWWQPVSVVAPSPRRVLARGYGQRAPPRLA